MRWFHLTKKMLKLRQLLGKTFSPKQLSLEKSSRKKFSVVRVKVYLMTLLETLQKNYLQRVVESEVVASFESLKRKRLVTLETMTIKICKLASQ